MLDQGVVIKHLDVMGGLWMGEFRPAYTCLVHSYLAKIYFVSLTMISVSCSEMPVAVSPITSSNSRHLLILSRSGDNALRYDYELRLSFEELLRS